jgi:N-acetylmuramoyl-L-alanine amidase
MPKRTQAASRVSIAAPIVLLAAIVLDVAWAGVGSRYGRHWYRFLFRPRPRGIVLHHSASGGYRDGKLLDAAAIDADHEKRGWSIEYRGKTYHIGYHYVILADGTVEAGRPEEVRGAHAAGYNDHLGICLIGNFSSSGNPDGRMQPARPTEQQLDALVGLLQELMDRYDFDVDDIHRHREFGQTACPGDRFPFEEVRDRLRPQGTESG